MKKLLTVTAAAALGLGLATTVLADKSPPGENSGKKADKVAICHFPGHDTDFIATTAARQRACERRGGNLIEINGNALGGHGLGG